MSSVRIGRRWFVVGLVLGLVMMLGLSACSQGEPPGQQTPGVGGELQGTIRVSGAWALYPMMVTWAEEFQELHPKVRIDVSAGGAGKGVADALAEIVDIGMVSREIRPEEIEQGAFFVTVVKDAVFPTMNANNPVWAAVAEKGVQRATFVDLWINGSSLTWGQVAGTESTDIVKVYTRSDACSGDLG